MKKYLSLFTILFLFAACGSVQNQATGSINDDDLDNVLSPLDDPDTDIPEDSDEIVYDDTFVAYMYGTAYGSNGQLFLTSTATLDTLFNSGVPSLGNDAIIKAQNNLVYVLHRGGAFVSGSTDNVQIIDPANSFATVNQWSTGNGTNPQDIIIIDNKAFISLGNPESDPDNVADNGKPGDVIVMNLDTGNIENRISFFDLLNDDDYKASNANKMLLIDDKIYVLVQDLGEGFNPYAINAAGHLVTLDATTGERLDSITLAGRNPVGLAVSHDKKTIYVSFGAPFDDWFTINEYETDEFGGLQILSAADTTHSTFIADNSFGGYLEGIATGNGLLYVTISHYNASNFSFTSNIWTMDETNTNVEGFFNLLPAAQDIRTFAIAPDGNLWVSYRTIFKETGIAGDATVEILDGITGDYTGTTYTPSAPVVSIAFEK
ncbi:hypothetical protein K1X76_00390 [bacterium]|nr:hypothetical protein [bacterium]